MKKSISVIMPLYGNAHPYRFNLVAESVFAQKGVSLDLIVAGLNNAQRIENLSKTEIPREVVPEIVRMGIIINRGLKLATGDFTYVTDSDILLANPEYLNNLVKEFYNLGTFLKRPPMRRLLLQDFDWFNSLVKKKGLEESLGLLDFSQDYIIKPANQERLIRVIKKSESGRLKTFIITEEDFQKYTSNEANKGSEPLYFTQDVHCGAVFALTKAFSDVGGYHDGFISWGVWDADVQWKLERLGGMNLIPKERRFEVIHLDHSRGYFDKNKWTQDQSLQTKRMELEAKKCIEQDREKYAEREYAI